MSKNTYLCLILIFSISAFGQKRVIKGTVVDEENAPLPGATIIIQDTNYGVTTDIEGDFSIDAKEGDILVISYLGFQTQIITIGDDENYTIKLLTGTELKEIVLTGVAGKTDLRKVSFSVGKVNETTLQQVPGVDPVSSLRGKVAGVRVIQGTGLPGVAPSIRIRGSSSLLGIQDPLIILDGTILDGQLADINSDDIENMEILKGSAAASLYGSRAANGVVQIFTKRGSRKYGSQIRLRTEIGFNFIPRSRQPSITQSHNYQLDDSGNFVRGSDGGYVLEDDRIADNPFPVYYDNLSLFYSANSMHNQSLQILNRTQTTTTNLSISNLSQDGILNFDHFGYERQTVRLNHDMKISDRLKLSTSTNLSSINQVEPDLGASSPFFYNSINSSPCRFIFT